MIREHATQDTAMQDSVDVPPQDAPSGLSAHATMRVPTAAISDSVGAVRASLPGAAFDCAADVVVLQPDGRPAGVVPMARLFAAEPSCPLQELIAPGRQVFTQADDAQRVANAVGGHGMSSVVVVDTQGRFAGLVPAERLLSILRGEHDEDMARLGGYLAGTRRARSAAEESVPHRLWHRLPWLLVGLAGAMASAVLIAAFEHQLDARVLLAFFVPGIVYMADAVGTQTEAVLIRGLSVGISMRRVVIRELVTGLVVGAVVGGAFFGFAALAWGDVQVAAAVGIALLASCSIATLVAMVLPWSFQRVGADPAFGSGPLATVVQDLLSIAVYLVCATVLVT